jgi:protein-L-isoaspartate(D-aspartate) O-methyltransferase
MKPMAEEHLAVLRRHMVELIANRADLLEEELGKAALDARVLEAMRRVPRHRFVPAPLAALAYDDAPLPIGFDNTISEPFLCALMADLLAPGPDMPRGAYGCAASWATHPRGSDRAAPGYPHRPSPP